MRLNIFRDGSVIYALIYHLKQRKEREKERYRVEFLTYNFNGRSFIPFFEKGLFIRRKAPGNGRFYFYIRDPIEIYKKCKWTGGEVWWKHR